MRENRMDIITDKLRLRVGRLLGSAHKQFKGSNPYRQEPISDEDRIQRYMQWAGTPMEDELRQQGIDVDTIHMNIQKLRDKAVRNA